MFLLLSIIFVICVILLIIRKTNKYTNIFVRVRLNHVSMPLFSYKFYTSLNY